MYNYNLLLGNFNSDDRENNINNNVLKTNNMQNNMTNNFTLFSPREGYALGNLFSNLYTPYKNYQPKKITPRNEQERMLLELSEYSFAAHELNLYLDNFPNDNSIIALFNDYRSEANRLREEYEKKYGPLTIGSNSLNNTPWMWVSKSWPWEGSDR